MYDPTYGWSVSTWFLFDGTDTYSGKKSVKLADDTKVSDVKLNVPDNADVSKMELYVGDQLYTPVKTGDSVGLIATTDTTDGITIAADSTTATTSTFRVTGVNNSYQDYTITVAKTADSGSGDIASGDVGNADGEEEVVRTLDDLRDKFNLPYKFPFEA